MHVVIFALDKADALPLRLQHYEAHKAYLASAPVKMVISGPLLGADGSTMIGSMFLLETTDLDEAVSFNRADPFHAAGLWERVEIRPFLKRVDNR